MQECYHALQDMRRRLYFFIYLKSIRVHAGHDVDPGVVQQPPEHQQHAAGQHYLTKHQ
jgi:hypothetical protein